MTHRQTSNVLKTVFSISFFAAALAGAAFAFVITVINSPNSTGQVLILITTAAFGLSAAVAVGSRIAMSRFYKRVCAAGFTQWLATPALGESIDGELLAELAGLAPSEAWIARQFLERKSVELNVGFQTADEPNRRRYRFPRSDLRVAVGEVDSTSA